MIDLQKKWSLENCGMLGLFFFPKRLLRAQQKRHGATFLGGMGLFFWGAMIFACSVPQKVWAEEPFVAPKELLVLKPAQDKVWGTWVAAVIHRGTEPAEISFLVNLPREAIDFQPVEGLDAKEISLSERGLTVRKTVSSGVNVVSVAFAVPASFGVATMTFVTSRELPEMSIMTPVGMMEVSADGLMAQGFDHQDQERYAVYATTKPLRAGEEFVLTAHGVPEGRMRLWILGGVVALVMSVGAVWLAIRTRPKLSPDDHVGERT